MGDVTPHVVAGMGVSGAGDMGDIPPAGWPGCRPSSSQGCHPDTQGSRPGLLTAAPSGLRSRDIASPLGHHWDMGHVPVQTVNRTAVTVDWDIWDIPPPGAPPQGVNP